MTSLPTNSISHLWRCARAWLAEMLADFISPAHVARTIVRQARVVFRKRLQRLEMLVRKLLLIEAMRYPGWSTRLQARAAPSVGSCAPGGARTSLPGPEHPDHPITWRVRFHTPGRPGRPRAAPPRIPHAPACPQTLALKLARRFEALRRVIADPRAAIAALARKLRALAGAARAFAQAIALASPRQGGGLIFGDATVRALDATFELPCDTT